MMQTKTVTEKDIVFGCEKFGRLKKVFLHRPGKELKLIDESNYKHWLFDRVPDISRYIEEHIKYEEFLNDLGIEVLQLGNYVNDSKVLMEKMPNLTFLHDTAVVSSKGAIISKMAMEGRRDEHLVVKEALVNAGIPVLHEFNGNGDAFEGCLLVSPDTILVADTERHKRISINKFIQNVLPYFHNIIYVEIPKARRFMHPDTIFNRITANLALIYPAAFKKTYLYTPQGVSEIDFVKYMDQKGIELINVSDEEQRNLACSLVPIEPGVIIHYDTALSRNTLNKLNKKKVEVLNFHAEELNSGGGSLRCHTLRLLRV